MSADGRTLETKNAAIADRYYNLDRRPMPLVSLFRGPQGY
jgi:hypothetical protein